VNAGEFIAVKLVDLYEYLRALDGLGETSNTYIVVVGEIS
jgi:hypothetical protein